MNQTDFDEYIPFHNQYGRDDIYQYAKVRRGDKWFFLKIAPTPATKQGLKREEVWSLFMDHVASAFPEARLRAPRFEGFVQDNAVLFEYIEAPQVVEHHMLQTWQASIDRYVQMLYVLDQAADGWKSELIQDDLHRAQEYKTIWERWLGNNIHSVERFNEALQLVADYLPHVTGRMQHGDLTPWQMFDDNGVWIIYDGEKCGTDLPRFNDLAYGYGRLFTKLHAPTVAASLLQKFLDYSGMNSNEFFDQFAPVMMGRAVGMMADAYNDQAKNDYMAEAQQLFDLCLERRLDRLLDPS